MDTQKTESKKNIAGKARVKSPAVNPVNWYVETNDFKVFNRTSNVWLDSLFALGRCLDYYEHLEEREAITVKNYHTQSIGNRPNRCRVETAVKIGNKIYSVKTPIGWSPSRDGLGYEFNDSVGHVKSYAGEVWKDVIQAHALLADMVDYKESLAWVGYFVCQLNTGELISSESSFKTDLLNTMIHIINPVSLDVKIYPLVVGDNVIYHHTLDTVKALIMAQFPRVSIIHKLPMRSNIRVTAGGKDKSGLGKKRAI